MKVLVISATPWSNDNSFGSTFSNFFEGIDGIEIANIYCMKGNPYNHVVSRYYQVTVEDNLRSIFKRKIPCGSEKQFSELKEPEKVAPEGKHYSMVRKLRWQVFYWANDLIWTLGNWKNAALDDFLTDFRPDIIFQPIYYSKHLNQIALYCKEKTGVPMVGYVADDVYTLHQFSLSPLYWIDRLWKRRYIKRSVCSCSLLYTISNIQKREYEEVFRFPCKVLTKSSDFSGDPPPAGEPCDFLRFVYTGNIGGGRWKSLAMLAKVLAKLNLREKRAQLDIYTATPLTAAMKRRLNISGSSAILGAVPGSRIPDIQNNADILVHAEGMNRKSRLEVHQSFSTKLVDYFRAGRCVFAIGTADMASIDHLLRHKAAIVADSEKSIEEQVLRLLSDQSLRSQTVCNAWNCGKHYHNKEVLQKMLCEDLNNQLKGS